MTTSWITDIQGITTLLDSTGASATRRRAAQFTDPSVALSDVGGITQIGPRSPQSIVGATGAWDGASAHILVGGSGSRALALANGSVVGQEVTIIEVGNSSGTITITPAGSIHGTATISAAYGFRRYCYVAAGVWVQT